MARINRHRRIGGRTHLGKSRIADFFFKEGRYQAFGAACLVGDYLASDAALSLTFNPVNITAGVGLVGPAGGAAGLTGALLAACLDGATYVLDFQRPNLTQAAAFMYCNDSGAFNSEWGLDEVPTTGISLYENTGGKTFSGALATRQQVGFNRLAITLGTRQLLASINGSAPVVVQSRRPVPAIAHIGFGMTLAAGALERVQIYKEVLNHELVESLSRI